MSEEPVIPEPAPAVEQAPPSEQVGDWKKPRQRVSEKTKVALIACIEQSRYTKLNNGRLTNIAIRCGVKYSTLRQVWYRWNKGLIDLGEPETPEERIVETKVEMLRTMDLTKRGEQFLNDLFEAAQVRVRAAAADGNHDAWFELKVDRLVGAMLQLARLRETKEKGFLAIIEGANNQQRALQREEKRLDGKTVDVPARVVRASEAQVLKELVTEP